MYNHENAAVALPSPDMPPMLRNYLEYKQQYPECIIFYQVGDFYEAFFQDAVTVSRSLNLTLTSRDKSQEDPTPMCGVPVGSIDGYLERLVAMGFSVALVSQANASSATRLPTIVRQESGPSKVVIQRKLSRIVTPGVRISSTAEETQPATVAALSMTGDQSCSLVFSQVQNGKLSVKDDLDLGGMFSELSKIGPAELLVPNDINGQKIDRRIPWVRRLEKILPQGALKFRVPEHGGSKRRDLTAISGYVALSAEAKKAVQLLTRYLDEVTIDSELSISEITTEFEQGILVIDAHTRANLELVKNSKDGSTQGTLYHHLNHTNTLAGARLLKTWITEPLAHIESIHNRHDAVALMLQEGESREALKKLFQGLPDLDRISARIELNLVQPRELAALRDCLERLPECKALLNSLAKPCELLEETAKEIERPEEAYRLLSERLADAPGLSMLEGEVIRKGFDAELDRLRQLQSSGAAWVTELEAKERNATGIQSLKVKFNYVLGYFIEITRANVEKVPNHYQRRQSTANSERYTTPDLKSRETEILGASEKAALRERQLYAELCLALRAFGLHFRKIQAHIACLDCILSLSTVAERETYVRPTIDTTKHLSIVRGQHPVVSQLLSGRFVPNSLEMDPKEEYCFVITGPNMGGKSTFLRQAGLIVIMAQLGSFVPASSARIGLVDKIFARLGATDNLHEGESTFMIEMREAAHILHGASDKSLILIDELGRGTATLDGLALAQAILEWMVQRLKSRALFATHFHELTKLSENYAGLGNLSVGSLEQDGEFVFTHEIKPGPANRSYGLEVAKLAGLSPELLGRANVLLEAFLQERENENRIGTSSHHQLSLFSEAPKEMKLTPHQEKSLRVGEEILELDLDRMSPLDALTTLYRIKQESR